MIYHYANESMLLHIINQQKKKKNGKMEVEKSIK